MMMAHFFESEIYAITDEEAKSLADATTAVTELYDMPLLSEKAMAWTQLATVAGRVYGPRVAAGFAEAKAKKHQHPRGGQVIEGARFGT